MLSKARRIKKIKFLFSCSICFFASSLLPVFALPSKVPYKIREYVERNLLNPQLYLYQYNTKLKHLTETQRKDIARLINLYYYIEQQQRLLANAKNETVIQYSTIASYHRKCTKPSQITSSDTNFLRRWKSFNDNISLIASSVLGYVNRSELLASTNRSVTNQSFEVSSYVRPNEDLIYLANWLKDYRRSLNDICDAISHIANQIRQSQVNFLVFTRIPSVEERIQLTDIDLILLLVNLMNLKDPNKISEVLEVNLNQVFELVEKDINSILNYYHLSNPLPFINVEGLGSFPVFDGIFDVNLSYSGQLNQNSRKVQVTLQNGSVVQIPVVQTQIKKSLCKDLRVFNAFSYTDATNFISSIVDNSWRKRINRLIETNSQNKFPKVVQELLSKPEYFGGGVPKTIYEGVNSLIIYTSPSLPSKFRSYRDKLNSLNLVCPLWL